MKLNLFTLILTQFDSFIHVTSNFYSDFDSHHHQTSIAEPINFNVFFPIFQPISHCKYTEPNSLQLFHNFEPDLQIELIDIVSDFLLKYLLFCTHLISNFWSIETLLLWTILIKTGGFIVKSFNDESSPLNFWNFEKLLTPIAPRYSMCFP